MGAHDFLADVVQALADSQDDLPDPRHTRRDRKIPIRCIGDVVSQR